MQAWEKQQRAASAETEIAFKRHILECSSGFASEPMADAFRVNLLAQMLDRYDALQAKGMSEPACRKRVTDEFDNIALQMHEMGFEELRQQEEDRLSRWPQLTAQEAESYIRERDAYVHRTALGIMMCTACGTPLMIGAAFSEFWYSDVCSLLGCVGMFAMIGMGVYAIVTAGKPKAEKRIRKGRFSLPGNLRQKLTQMRDESEAKARKRKGLGVALIVTSLIPLFIGAALMELWWSDGWAVLGLAGMFPMISAGVYELVVADEEKKTMGRLLKNKE